MHPPNSGKNLEDLEELIKLAEKTSEKIEHIRNRITTLKTAIAILAVAAYFGVAIGLYLGLKVKADLNEQWATIGLAITASIAAIVAIFAVKIVLDAFQKLRKMRNELSTEAMIQDRLLNMIFDQLNLARSESDLSIVHLALLDMRIQRLQGSS